MTWNDRTAQRIMSPARCRVDVAERMVASIALVLVLKLTV
jgi:hypothetical protein